jgi:hypothetical protein
MMARQWRCGASDALHDSSHDLFCAGDDDHVRDDLNSATEIAAPPPPAARRREGDSLCSPAMSICKMICKDEARLISSPLRGDAGRSVEQAVSS